MKTEVKSEIHRSNGEVLGHRRIGYHKLRIELPRHISQKRSNEIRKFLLAEVPGVCRVKPVGRDNNGKGISFLVTMRFRNAGVTPEELIDEVLTSATTKIANMKRRNRTALSSRPRRSKEPRFVKKPKSALAT